MFFVKSIFMLLVFLLYNQAVLQKAQVGKIKLSFNLLSNPGHCSVYGVHWPEASMSDVVRGEYIVFGAD